MALEQLNRSVDFVSDTAPSNANDGETFVDTSASPPTVKVFDGSAGAFVTPENAADTLNPLTDGDTIGQNDASISTQTTTTVTLLDSSNPVLVPVWNWTIDVNGTNPNGSVGIDIGKTGTFTFCFDVINRTSAEGSFNNLFFPNGVLIEMEVTGDSGNNISSSLSFDITFVNV
jgi:hypothetical protein